MVSARNPRWPIGHRLAVLNEANRYAAKSIEKTPQKMKYTWISAVEKTLKRCQCQMILAGLANCLVYRGTLTLSRQMILREKGIGLVEVHLLILFTYSLLKTHAHSAEGASVLLKVYGHLKKTKTSKADSRGWSSKKRPKACLQNRHQCHLWLGSNFFSLNVFKDVP